jgi:hypothetical protein
MNTATLKVTVTIEMETNGKINRTIEDYHYQIKPSEWLTLRNKLDEMNQNHPRRVTDKPLPLA